MMATLPPRKNPTPTKISKQHLTPLQILLQMGFPKHRAEKALAATGNKSVQLASDWLLAHVNDPLLDDDSPREYILYACPTGVFLEQLQTFWEESLRLCGWNGAHNFTPHITLVSFFKAPDEDAPHLTQSLKAVMERQGAVLNESLKLETYTSPNFMGFFVSEEHADYLKRIAMQYVKEVSNAIISDTYEHFDALTACFPWCTTTTARCIPRGSRSISLEPHVKSLHLTLAYQFPSSQYSSLKALVDKLDPTISADWELRLYSRDPRINGKQVHKVIHPYSPTESDELDLRKGDYVYISSEALANSPDGWVEGISWLTGCSGLLPESYTQRTAESDAWTLHRKISLTRTGSLDKQQQRHFTTSQVDCLNRTSVCSQDVSEREDKMNDKAEKKGDIVELDGEADYQMPSTPETVKISDLHEVCSKDLQAENVKRRIILMRHGERVDYTFADWIKYCFDEAGNYIRKDLNMPMTLPKRKSGPMGYYLDSPLTRIGVYQAFTIGEAMKEENITIEYAYTSPSFRSIMTCDGVLAGLNVKDQVKIRIEPGLFEWLTWYHKEGLPDWLTPEELVAAGFNIDTEYEPLFNVNQFSDLKEPCARFYERNFNCVKKFLDNHPCGNLLIVGHACTLDVCSRGLIEQPPRSANEMTKLVQRVPYCGVAQVALIGNKWELTEPPCFPMIHGLNQKYDWKIML